MSTWRALIAVVKLYQKCPAFKVCRRSNLFAGFDAFQKLKPEAIKWWGKERQPQLWCFNITTVLFWLGMITEKEYRDMLNPLKVTIKRGILSMQEKRFDEAEIILHLALSLTQQLAFEEAEMYVVDVLANNAFEKGDHRKAETLFLDVLRRYLSRGGKLDDEAVVEISLKLAMIYSKSGDLNKANEGFKFCFDCQQQRVSSIDLKKAELDDREKNSLALLGQCLDWRAKHWISIGRSESAFQDYLRSLELCQTVNGSNHPQTLVLFNDIATVLVDLDRCEEAVEYLNKAIRGAIKIDYEDISTFYCNLGKIFLRQFKINEAQFACRESLNFATHFKHKEVEELARSCLNDAGLAM